MSGVASFIQSELVHTGAPVRYWTCGRDRAPWLAICHGGGLDHRSFRPLAESLSDHFRVLLWDLPGHGESRPMPRPYRVERVVDAFEQVLKAVGAEEPALLGFSYGGVVVERYAYRRPERIAPIVLYGCLVPHVLKPLAPPQLAPALKVALQLQSWTKLKQDFLAMCSPRDEVRKALAPVLERLGKRDFIDMLGSLYFVAGYDPAFRFRGPTHFIHGGLDPAFLNPHWRIVEQMRARYPDMTLDVMEGLGHCAHQEEPERFIEIVKARLLA